MAGVLSAVSLTKNTNDPSAAAAAALPPSAAYKAPVAAAKSGPRRPQLTAFDRDIRHRLHNSLTYAVQARGRQPWRAFLRGPLPEQS